MSNENKNLNESSLNTTEQKSDFHDDFEVKDEFAKEKVDLKKLNLKKVLTIVLGGLALIALMTVGVYAKLKKNKEMRAEAGVETAVSKPIESSDSGNNTQDNFGFSRTQLGNDGTTDPNAPPTKTPEQLEAERQLAEQQAQLVMQQEQAKQEALAREQALLNARHKSGILVDGNSGKNSSLSPNGGNGLEGVPPELQPLFAGMQLQNNGSQQNANTSNSRITNTTASSMGGRFDSSTTNVKAPIANASYKADRRLIIQQGKIIDAVLETAIKSDLPSNIIARTSYDIYSEQGRNILLPKGTRLFGQYSSMINDGQTEIGAVWNRAITPNGVEIMLDSPSTNGLGMAGLGGKVNNHYGRIFGTATLLSLIGAGVSNVDVGKNDQNNASQTYRTEVAGSFSNQANSILNRNMSIPPTITVKHGERIKVLVAKDLDFSTIFNQ